MLELIDTSYVASTGAGCATCWAAMRVHVKYLLRELDEIKSRLIAVESDLRSRGV